MKRNFFLFGAFFAASLFFLPSSAFAQTCSIGVRNGNCIELTETCASGITGMDSVNCGGTKICCGQSASTCADQGNNSSCQMVTSCNGTPLGQFNCPSGQTCCKPASSTTNTCTSNCGTDGTCACTTSASCTSPKTTVSAGNSYCSAQTAGNVCCKTSSSSGGGGTSALSCPDGFEPYAGACFPTSEKTGLSKASVADIVVKVMKWLLYLFGFIAVIAFVISGMQYLLAAGNQRIMEIAKRSMLYSIVGIVVALAGLVILIAIDTLLRG